MKPGDVVVFLGPSLPAAEARAIAPCTVLPPARQGDVWRALERHPRPSALALIDGRFEQVPSVWHRELVDALRAGVAVVGGASMGAIRAAELRSFGMRGAGVIARWYRDGLLDDAEVALLHAGPEHGWRPFTVPQVNVRHAATVAARRGVLSPREAAALVAASEATFYQDRTWPAVLAALGRRWSAGARARWQAFAAGGLPDLKAMDARAAIRLAARLARAGRSRGR